MGTGGMYEFNGRKLYGDGREVEDTRSEVPKNCALCNGSLAGKLRFGEHHRHLTDCVSELQAQLWRYRDAIQRARILLDGLGHKSEDEARLVEEIDRELRTARSAKA